MKFVTKSQNIEIKETESALFVLFYCILCVYFFHLKHKQKFIIITTKGSIQFQSNINDRQIYEKLKWFVIVCVYEIDFVMVNAFWSIKKKYHMNWIQLKSEYCFSSSSSKTTTTSHRYLHRPAKPIRVQLFCNELQIKEFVYLPEA